MVCLCVSFMSVGRIRTPEEAHLLAGLVQDGSKMEKFFIKGASLDLISLGQSKQPKSFDEAALQSGNLWSAETLQVVT